MKIVFIHYINRVKIYTCKVRQVLTINRYNYLVNKDQNRNYSSQ